MLTFFKNERKGKETFADASYRLVIDKVKSGTRPGLEGGRRSPESSIFE